MRSLSAFCLLALSVAPLLAQEKKAASAPAQEQQVLALVNRVQNDLKADHRAEAAEVLHHYDGNHFPEIMPVLIQVLERDADPNVRKEAARSLGKLKPTSAEALDALHKAAEHDAVLKVRLAARMARMGYKAPSPPPSAPLPQAPSPKWADKLTFWKKKPVTPQPAPAPVQAPPVVSTGASPAPLPKPPLAAEGPLLLPPPPQ